MGNSRWFNQMLQGYEKRLVRYASKKVPLAAARELVQECFLRLWREHPQDLAGREAAWLFTVTRNLCLDWLKKERPLVHTLPGEAVSDEEPVLDQMVRREEEEMVRKIIDRLNENQQEVLRLKFQEGFSYKQISEITGHSTSYVGVLIHEAITRVREELAAKTQPNRGAR